MQSAEARQGGKGGEVGEPAGGDGRGILCLVPGFHQKGGGPHGGGAATQPCREVCMVAVPCSAVPPQHPPPCALMSIAASPDSSGFAAATDMPCQGHGEPPTQSFTTQAKARVSRPQGPIRVALCIILAPSRYFLPPTLALAGGRLSLSLSLSLSPAPHPPSLCPFFCMLACLSVCVCVGVCVGVLVCVFTAFVNGPKDVQGCSAVPQELSFTAFLALFLFLRSSLCVCVCVCVFSSVPFSLSATFFAPLMRMPGTCAPSASRCISIRIGYRLVLGPFTITKCVCVCARGAGVELLAGSSPVLCTAERRLVPRLNMPLF